MIQRTVLLLLVTIAPAALGAGSSSSSTRPSAADDYQRAVAAVDSGAYGEAARLLERVVRGDPRNADAWNYLGFSRRKLGAFEASMAAYRKALAIDPSHRGANEYLGELYLDLGDLDKARGQLGRLKYLCPAGCKERSDLEAAIARRGAG